jgi:uncharacterized protein YdcH (DUF465 family)
MNYILQFKIKNSSFNSLFHTTKELKSQLSITVKTQKSGGDKESHLVKTRND